MEHVNSGIKYVVYKLKYEITKMKYTITKLKHAIIVHKINNKTKKREGKTYMFEFQYSTFISVALRVDSYRSLDKSESRFSKESRNLDHSIFTIC